MAETARRKLRGPPAGVWRFEQERRARWWCTYSCVAVASEGGDEFRLVCEWERPVYTLTVTSRRLGSDAPIFYRWLFADEDCDDVVRRVMRIARQDIARRLARLNQLHRDLMIGASKVCVAGKRAGAEKSATADRPRE